ncbi:MAG TPA: DinB family protein [Bacteroidota bacterium]|nr:DinB family protein [Bacteroidota bacterium]
MKYISLTLVAFAIFASFAIAVAQDNSGGIGYRSDILNDLKGSEKKLTDLAEAMPDSTYSWRPMKGVRSVSEVFAHIAADNYNIISKAGVKLPEGVVPKEFEKKYTTKADCVDALKKSFAFIRDSFNATSDADLGKPTDFYGTKTTVGGIYFSNALHVHEHLGQSIAYARANNVVPPWTAEQQKNTKMKMGN